MPKTSIDYYDWESSTDTLSDERELSNEKSSVAYSYSESIPVVYLLYS
jgi:hypothetical protein